MTNCDAFTQCAIFPVHFNNWENLETCVKYHVMRNVGQTNGASSHTFAVLLIVHSPQHLPVNLARFQPVNFV